MIVNDFYPTVTDKTSIMGMAFTAELQSIPATDPEFTQAYWLGWMRWDNLPLQYHVSRATFEDGVLTFTDITKPENVPVGFSIHNKNYYDYYPYGISEVKYDGTKWASIDYVYSSTASTNFYLPNSLDINVLSWGRLRLIFLAMSEDRSIVLQSIISDVPYADFAAGSNMTAVVLDSGSFINQTFTVTKDDISNHAIFQKEINGTVFDIVLASYTVPYNRDVRFNDSVDDYAAVHPMVKVHTIDDIPYVSGITNPVQYQFRDDCNWGSGYLGQGFFSNWSGMVDRLSSSRITDIIWDRFGGFVGSFKVSDLAPFAIDLFVPEGATFYVRGIGRNDINIIGRVLTYDEILHCLSLLPRMQDTTINRYEQNASYWYGHVDKSSGEFLGELVNGSQTDLLVDWQLLNNNIVDNDFTEDEIPEYAPPGQDNEPHGGPGWLANNVFPYGALNGFVTLYCLTPKQLGAFGQYLWAGFFDTDFIDSLVVTAFEAASINTSDILNFIPSVKYYPISLDSLNNWHSGGDSTIFIGRGSKGIDLNTAAHVGNLTAYCAGVDCESEDIEPEFGDFRDFEPCTRLTLFVPFCGVMELTPSQVMGKGQPGKVYLKYLIDFSTGACECAVEIKNCGWRTIVGTLSGSIGANVELTASNLSQVIQSFGKAVVGVGATVALATVGLGQASALEEMGGRATQAEAAMSNAEKGLLANQANNINSLLSLNTVPAPTAGTSGGYSAFINLAPMIQRTYHHYEVPANYAHVYGYACNKTVTLSDLKGKGYTVCSNVELSGIPATQDELAAIESLLTSGVYF